MLQCTIAHAISILDEDPARCWAQRGPPRQGAGAGRDPETQRQGVVMETTVNVKAKAKPASSGFDSKFEMPKFDMPKMEVPAAFREIAEKSVSTAKENYEKLKVAAEEATNVLEET